MRIGPTVPVTTGFILCVLVFGNTNVFFTSFTCTCIFRFISVLIDIIASSADFVKLHDGLCSDSVEIITTVFIPSCVWKGGR